MHQNHGRMPRKFDLAAFDATLAANGGGTQNPVSRHAPSRLDARAATPGILTTAEDFAIHLHEQDSIANIIVDASSRGDRIGLFPGTGANGDHAVRLTINGHEIMLQLAAAQRIVILARGGDDLVEVDPRVTCDVQVLGGGGNDILRTAPGIEATTGSNIIAFWGEDGDDTLVVGGPTFGEVAKSGTLLLAHGDAGEDLILASGANVIADGGDGADRIRVQGTTSADCAPSVYGAAGDDVIEAQYGNVYINTGTGHDTVYVGTFQPPGTDDEGLKHHADVDIDAEPHDRIKVAAGSVARVKYRDSE